MRKGRAAVLAFAWAAVLFACGGEDRTAIAVDRPMLHLFGGEVTEPPVQLRDANGRAVPWYRADLESEDPGTLAVTDSGFRCKRLGSTSVRIRYRRRFEALRVSCRPLPRQIRTEGTILLDVTDPPRPLRFIAEWPDAPDEPVMPVLLSAVDSTVARVEGAAVRPLRVGRTSVVAVLGGTRRPVYIVVTERLAEDTIPFTPRTFRRWELRPGLYALTMRRNPPRDGPTGFDVVTEGARCARRAGDDDTIYCAVKDTGSVSVYSGARDARRSREFATVDLWRMPP